MRSWCTCIGMWVTCVCMACVGSGVHRDVWSIFVCGLQLCVDTSGLTKAGRFYSRGPPSQWRRWEGTLPDLWPQWSISPLSSARGQLNRRGYIDQRKKSQKYWTLYLNYPAHFTYITLHTVPYSGKLLREKTCANWWKIRFSRRKLSWIARSCCAKGHHAPKFRRENFRE